MSERTKLNSRLGRSALGWVNKLFRQGGSAETPDPYSLGTQIASTIQGFVIIRGLNTLCKPETAIVMDHENGVSLTQNVEGMRQRNIVKAVAYLKDIESYEEFKHFQSDATLRSGPLGQLTMNQLALQLSRQLLKQIR